MNKVILIGRLVKDPELKTVNNDIPYCQFSLAVNRPFQSKSGEKQVDFITCVAWRKSAELVTRYVKKGQQISIEGSLQTRSYDDKNGAKHFVTEVIVSNLYFMDNKQSQQNNDYNVSPNDFNNNNRQKNQQVTILQQDEYSDYLDISNDDIPF